MENLHHALWALTRAVRFQNLTGASQQVGLSQPQLSRLIKQLEEELGLTLLDRKSKRQTQWTQTAQKLADIYRHSHFKLEAQIANLQDLNQPTSVSVGTLEGLSGLAFQLVEHLVQVKGLSLIHLDIYDLDDMEALFLGGELDLVFSSRTPGKKKLHHTRELGHQGFLTYESPRPVAVKSHFEYALIKRDQSTQYFVSNSVSLRRRFLEELGGNGKLPGPVKRKNKKNEEEVLVLGKDHLAKVVWDQVLKL